MENINQWGEWILGWKKGKKEWKNEDKEKKVKQKEGKETHAWVEGGKPNFHSIF
jgi:hypothetical protein